MDTDFGSYLKEIKFEKHLKKLVSKLKNKKIIIYGAGSLFLYIKDNYDLSGLNIIGISDMKFREEDEGQVYQGYKIIQKDKIVNSNPDFVLIAVQNYLGLLENFMCNVFKDTKIKVGVLVKKPFWTVMKDIWLC